MNNVPDFPLNRQMNNVPDFPLNSDPLAKIEGSAVYYYHNDHLGTPQKLTDATGAVVWDAEYKPFGEVAIATSAITNNLRFPGQYFDAETEQHYNYFRDYNPAIGRYVEADPIGLAGGVGGRDKFVCICQRRADRASGPVGFGSG